MGSKKKKVPVKLEKESPSKSELLRMVIAEILEDYEKAGVAPPDFNDIVRLLEEAGVGFSVRTDFLRITLGAGISPVRITWNHLVIWRDRPWRGKQGQVKKKKPTKKK
jgi:hypothetical protein